MSRLFRTLTIVYWIAGIAFLAFILIDAFNKEYSGLLGLPSGPVWILCALGLMAAAVLMVLAGIYDILIGFLQEIIGIDLSSRPHSSPASRSTSQSSSSLPAASWFRSDPEPQGRAPHTRPDDPIRSSDRRARLQ